MTHRDPWTETLLLAALAARFDAPAYAFLTHVPNATGGRADRTIDAVAMGLWPSRGLDLQGFEIKVDRRDWLRELKNPAKADGWRFDQFWLVTPLDLVKPHEVPPLWGLMEARNTTNGVRLAVTKDAPQQKPKPLTRQMLAGLMRKIHARALADTAIEQARAAADAAGYKRGLAEAQGAIAERDLLRNSIAAFEARVGVTFDQWTWRHQGGRIAERLDVADALDMLRLHDGLAESLRQLRSLVRSVEGCAEIVKEEMAHATDTTTPEAASGSGAARATAADATETATT